MAAHVPIGSQTTEVRESVTFVRLAFGQDPARLGGDRPSRECRQAAADAARASGSRTWSKVARTAEGARPPRPDHRCRPCRHDQRRRV